MTQLSFCWPANVSRAAQDFFVSEANRAAHAMVTDPALWPQGKLVLTGPALSGKSHLARLFAAQTGAQTLDAAAQSAQSPLPEPHPTLIENADRLPPEAEEWLFHLHNSLSGRAPLLLTARTEPGRWPIRLPDLASRMSATTCARIAAPDDALLTAVIIKLFADRQLRFDADLPPYLTARIERSFAAAASIVAQLDAAALQTGRRLGPRLASDVISGKIAAPQ